jgi:hypothetical protein
VVLSPACNCCHNRIPYLRHSKLTHSSIKHLSRTKETRIISQGYRYRTSSPVSRASAFTDIVKRHPQIFTLWFQHILVLSVIVLGFYVSCSAVAFAVLLLRKATRKVTSSVAPPPPPMVVHSTKKKTVALPSSLSSFQAIPGFDNAYACQGKPCFGRCQHSRDTQRVYICHLVANRVSFCHYGGCLCLGFSLAVFIHKVCHNPTMMPSMLQWHSSQFCHAIRWSNCTTHASVSSINTWYWYRVYR